MRHYACPKVRWSSFSGYNHLAAFSTLFEVDFPLELVRAFVTQIRMASYPVVTIAVILTNDLGLSRAFDDYGVGFRPVNLRVDLRCAVKHLAAK
jgi:hypothetical protein